MIERNEFDKIEKDDVAIGFPVTPSRWLDDIVYRPMTVVTMTCGGGMGGSSWHEYVERDSLSLADLEKAVPGTMIKVKCYDGSVKMLNTNYIVSARSDITMFEFGIYTFNENFGPGEIRYRRLCRDGVTVKRVSEYRG